MVSRCAGVLCDLGSAAAVLGKPPSIGQALDTEAAAAKIAAESEVQQAVTLNAKEYAITRRVKAGDRIYVYDPGRGLYDQGTALNFHGRTIYPILLRIQEISWPVEAGMHVFLDQRHQTVFNDVIDLTQYVEFRDPGPTSITVGRVPRTMSAAISRR